MIIKHVNDNDHENDNDNDNENDNDDDNDHYNNDDDNGDADGGVGLGGRWRMVGWAHGGVGVREESGRMDGQHTAIHIATF